jgi:pimeloyl-ACP methyl ester carboxylesterase
LLLLCKSPSASNPLQRSETNEVSGEDKDGNPFKSGGYMEHWTMVGKAKTIAVPTLVINGIDEFASGDAVKPFLDEIPDVRLVTLEGTTHSPHFEKKEEYMKIVGDFLSTP